MKFKIEYMKNGEHKSAESSMNTIEEAIIYFLRSCPEAKITQIWEKKFQSVF